MELDTSNGPRVIILGGCGFIGRHLVDYLISNKIVSAIRVVDKTPPQIAYLNQFHRSLFDNPIVEFVSANLINEVSCKNAFLPPNGSMSWDYVFNCAAETKIGQIDAVYSEGITKLSLNCAKESASYKVSRYIEFSSGCMYSSAKIPITEDCPYEPWNLNAKHKANVEKQLSTITDLKYTILRLPLVYGKGDRNGVIASRVIITALYKYMNETMKLLWNDAMKMNSIHVYDVVAAAWHLATNQQSIGQIYNIVDDSNTTQGKLSNILADIFNVNVDYWGVVMSNVTKVKINDVLDEINDKHLGPWAEICQRDGIENTPLLPYLNEEQLLYKHINLDNSKLKKIGYILKYPIIERKLIEEIINDFITEGLYPLSLGF